MKEFLRKRLEPIYLRESLIVQNFNFNQRAYPFFTGVARGKYSFLGLLK